MIGSTRTNLTAGFTASSLSATGVPMLNMQQVVDFASASRAVEGLSVDIDKLRSIYAEGMKVAMGQEQLYGQIRTQTSALLVLLPAALAAALGGDVGKQLEIAKKLAMQMATLLANANMAAFGYNADPEKQMQILTAAHRANAAVAKYLAALEELKKDPTNHMLRAAAEAARVEAESAILAFNAITIGFLSSIPFYLSFIHTFIHTFIYTFINSFIHPFLSL